MSEAEWFPHGGDGRGRVLEALLAGRGPFLKGDIQAPLAVQVVVTRDQGVHGRLRLDRIAGSMVLDYMDAAVRHEADVRPCPDLEGEEGEEQEYRPATGMSEIAWHMVRDG